MHRLLSILLLFALLVTTPGAALAQDAPGTSDPDASPQVFVPLISSGGAAVQTAGPEQPVAPVADAAKDKQPKEKPNKPTQKDRKEAAARALQAGALNPLMVEAAAMPIIDGAPHYFSHPNYANSQLPTVEGTVIAVGNPLQDRAYASDFPVGVGSWRPCLSSFRRHCQTG